MSDKESLLKKEKKKKEKKKKEKEKKKKEKEKKYVCEKCPHRPPQSLTPPQSKTIKKQTQKNYNKLLKIT